MSDERITLTPEEAIGLLGDPSSSDRTLTFLAGHHAPWLTDELTAEIRRATERRVECHLVIERPDRVPLFIAIKVAATKTSDGETTSPEVATVASRGLATGVLTPAETRTVCASALTQVADRGAPVASEAERLLAALGAADADLSTVAGDRGGYAVFDPIKADEIGDSPAGAAPIAALRAAFPEVASAAPGAGEAGR